jgi:hypothetical protein
MSETARSLSRKPMPPHQGLWSEYDIDATSSMTDSVLQTLKHGDAFAVLDSHGDIGRSGGTAEGLYFRDMRFLSRYELRIEGARPLLLGGAAHEDKTALSVEPSLFGTPFVTSVLVSEAIGRNLYDFASTFCSTPTFMTCSKCVARAGNAMALKTFGY